MNSCRQPGRHPTRNCNKLSFLVFLENIPVYSEARLNERVDCVLLGVGGACVLVANTTTLWQIGLWKFIQKKVLGRSLWCIIYFVHTLMKVAIAQFTWAFAYGEGYLILFWLCALCWCRVAGKQRNKNKEEGINTSNTATTQQPQLQGPLLCWMGSLLISTQGGASSCLFSGGPSASQTTNPRTYN